MSDITEMNKYYQTKNNYLNEKQSEFLNVNNSDTLYIDNSHHIMQNFYKVNIKEIEPTIHNINKHVYEENLSLIIDELFNLIFNEVNKGREENAIKQQFFNYINNQKINLQEIYYWLQNNKTCSNSIYLLGYFNYNGIWIDINKQNAFELYQKAAELENIVAQFELSNMYMDEDCVDKDYASAFELSKILAEENYPCGINLLGYCYRLGIGTNVDVQKAFELYQKAADLENLYGICNLGVCYENGTGTEVNEQKAFELYQKAADLGHSQGMHNLGFCYNNGIGTDFDEKKAFELYEKAAKLGNNFAQYDLALMYEFGYAVKNDFNQAIYWLKKSAEQGNKNAQIDLKILLKE
jgi:TPR repeat protein